MGGIRRFQSGLGVGRSGATQPATNDTTQVPTDTGMIDAEAGGVIGLKGIPYAAPPVSGLRWRMPQPANGNPRSASIYLSAYPKENDGKTAHRLTVKDVPVDGFWSISLYGAKGYFEKNDLGEERSSTAAGNPRRRSR